MSYAQYRLYLNGAAATADQLSRFEDITIEQEMDMACQGRFQVPVCVLRTGCGAARRKVSCRACTASASKCRSRARSGCRSSTGP